MRTLDVLEINQACQAALEEVLETMFFELPGDIPAPPAPPLDAAYARARFKGSLHGEFQLAVGSDTLDRLTSNFLGLDDEAPPCASQSQHVLCELANMLCGASLSRLEPEGRLQIEQPQPTRQPGLSTAWIGSPLDPGAIWAALRLNETPVEDF